MCVYFVEIIVCWEDWIGLTPWWFYDCISHAHAFSCIRTLHSLYSYILIVIGALLHVSFFPSLSLVYVSCVMPPKRKSTPSRNPLRFGASTSCDPTPSHVRFCDDKTRQDFSKNFSRRGIHSEGQVILLDFSDTDLPTVNYSRGTRVLLQQAWIWLFSTSLCHSCSRYAHHGHSEYCIQTCSMSFR